MHLGNARTALFNALLARSQQGVFLLRIEDTDRTRSQAQFTEAMMRDLRWLGLDWQEGADAKGDAGPYWQSQRQGIYDDYYAKLEQQGLAYPCFCSESDLTLMRKLQRAAGKPPRYDGRCRSLTAAEIEEKVAAGEKAVLRFHVRSGQEILFTDLVRGEQRFKSDDIGDFIIRRTDGTSPFMYCNAIDDALMGVSHALRGEDHLTNTPRQLLILRALELPEPQYGHITLIVGDDGSPLSKRHGSQDIAQLWELGYLSDALNNYLARLGHHYADESFMSLQQLAENFHITSLNKSPAKFNLAQLQHWQKLAVMQIKPENAWHWLGEAVQQAVPADKQAEFAQVILPNILFPKEALQWAQILFDPALNYTEEMLAVMDGAGKDYFVALHAAWQTHGKEAKAIIQTLKDELKIKGKALFQPLRVVLTGQLHGPELAPLLALMLDACVEKRLQDAQSSFN